MDKVDPVALAYPPKQRRIRPEPKPIPADMRDFETEDGGRKTKARVLRPPSSVLRLLLTEMKTDDAAGQNAEARRFAHLLAALEEHLKPYADAQEGTAGADERLRRLCQ